MSIRIQTGDFDPGAVLEALTAGRTDVGAVASFTGHVRGTGVGGALLALTLEHYPGMTERAIGAIDAAARKRFALLDTAIIHRVGRLTPGERIVLVGAAAPHRQAALDGVAFLMDYLKSRAPFWKKEETEAGSAWVEARASDEAALRRWS